jgi:aryl-alcohol dehydrogenase-like predicted oxidoreductase
LAGQPGEVLAAVRAVAERTGATVAQVALKWVISHPEATCAISGADTDAQMDENLGAVAVELAPEEIARLDEVSGGLRMPLDGPQYAPVRA